MKLVRKIFTVGLATMTVCLCQACGSVSGAAKSAQTSLSKEAVESTKNSNTPVENQTSYSSTTETTQENFVWEPVILENCGTYSNSASARGLIAGNKGNLYYLGGAEDNGWEVYAYDLNTKQKSDTGVRASDPLQLYEGSLYYSNSENYYTLERYDIVDDKKEELGWDDRLGKNILDWAVIGGDVYFIDREAAQLCVRKADGSIKVLGNNIDINFLDYNNTQVFYAKLDENSSTIYAYNIKTDSTTKLATISSSPEQVFDHYIISSSSYRSNYCIYDLSTGTTEEFSSKGSGLIADVLGNGNALFYIMENKAEGTLTLYAKDMETKVDYELGPIPDDLLATVGGRLYSMSNPENGNISLLNITDGKVKTEVIEMDDPYPYAS